MDIGILGPVEVSIDGRMLQLGGPRTHAVLAALCLDAGKMVSTDRLIEVLWGEHPPATARSQVQICVSTLRRVFAAAAGPGGPQVLIETRPPGYALTLTGARLDARLFEERAAQAARLADDGALHEAAGLFRTALELWRGPPLAGLHGELLEASARHLDERRLAVLERRIDVDLQLGRHAELVAELGELIVQHPLHEWFYGALMTALHRCGRRARALEVYRRARAVLVEELGIEPGAELRRIEQLVLAGAPEGPVPPEPPPREPGRDGAEPRPAQPAEPRPAQPAETPQPPGGEPPRAARPRPVPPNQLPLDTADFTGRATEVARVTAAVTGTAGHSATRQPAIVAIAGPGGVGKSALALHVAHALRHAFPDGTLYANLSDGTQPVHPAEILGRFLRALGVNGLSIPGGVDSLGEIYRDLISDRRILIVLDSAVDETQVLPLLPGNEPAAVIVTSRQRLTALPGAMHVSLDVLPPEPSVDLLAAVVGTAGAAGTGRDDAALAELATLCGGLPLALRIAGARLASRPHWKPSRLIGRMRDETRRLDELEHGALGVRASIAVSYSGLGPGAQRLLRLLACLDTPEFGAWVAAALLDVALDDAEDLVDDLVGAHLLAVLAETPDGPGRFRLHDLVRVFARERAQSEEPDGQRTAAVRRALAGWLHLAEEAHRREYGGRYTILHGTEPRWALPGSAAAALLEQPIRWLEAERQALTAAVRQAVRNRWDELAWDLALTLVTLFEARSYLVDWRESAELALALARQVDNRRGMAAMQYTLGALDIVEQRYAGAGDRLRQALDGFTACGDHHGRGLVLRNLAFLDRITGRPDLARAGYEQALPILREAGDQIAVAHVLCSLAALRLEAGDANQAQKILDDALVITQIAGSRRVQGQVLFRLGEVHLVRDELDRAAEAFHQVLRLTRDQGDRLGEAYALLGLGKVRHREARHGPAETALSQALQLAEELGDRLVQAHALLALGLLDVARDEPARAGERLDAAVRTFGAVGATVQQVNALVVLGEQRLRLGDTHGAMRAAVSAGTLLGDVDRDDDTAETRGLRQRISALIPPA
ncbi:tetratricopeptide repeat protein [Dactylosporangium aurantiacum]|uniref:Tetratricopeptide repeat protein n=1 Tax=Dactylosporangium aurantiacum TaxID=35754 RepID=A0A9Q9IME1_9ACTN|nr:AfsR/SARP family transcriptional regulator [Dactylosporangium aurantiacum]MDG6106288.1 BTAD domain-containing putative transcriptional regulator [Dactylosporangium aurantiacum]UWZ58216.1 tetratricopeptide repeat protein [Dactylosporangium aurantiacum]